MTFDEYYQKAKELTEQRKPWHHHYLPPGCAFSTSDQHQLVLEYEGEKLAVDFDHKPLPELERIDILFRTQRH